MAYQIKYGPAVKGEKAVGIWKKRLVVIFLIAMLTSVMEIAGIGSFVRGKLLPGDQEVTANALQTMTDRLREGESVAEVIECFCREIIDNADLP